MLSAFHEVITGREPDTLRAYMLAVLVQMLAVNAFIEIENVNVPYLRFFGFATAIGGFVLGLGMVLAMGCAGAMFYRAGEGKLDYVFATLAFAISAWASDNWLVEPVRNWLGGDGVALALPRALGMDRWVVVASVALAAFLYLFRGRRLRVKGWNWLQTGVALGLIGVGAWITSSLTGQTSGLGTLRGSRNIGALVLEGDWTALNWNLFMVAAIPVGSFLASRRHGVSTHIKPFTSRRILQAITGGILMGIGATVAGGDNILHGMSGVPILALNSIVVMLCIFAGVWVGIRMGWLMSAG